MITDGVAKKRSLIKIRFIVAAEDKLKVSPGERGEGVGLFSACEINEVTQFSPFFVISGASGWNSYKSFQFPGLRRGSPASSRRLRPCNIFCVFFPRRDTISTPSDGHPSKKLLGIPTEASADEVRNVPRTEQRVCKDRC